MPATILIADDHEDNRELLRLLLAAAGYDVREARDGNECLTFAQDEPPDLIVLDLSMPGMDGWGVLRELKADNERKRYRAWPSRPTRILDELKPWKTASLLMFQNPSVAITFCRPLQQFSPGNKPTDEN